jgi:capsid protein
MSRLASLALSAVLCLGAVPATSGLARAADYGAAVADDGSVCAEGWVLGRISRNFRHQVKNVPGLPDVEIVDFHGLRLTRHHPQRETWPVARTYCAGTVRLSDGRDRSIWYFIEEGMGFAGVGHNVEACVAGFDRWNVYNGRCRVAQ